MPHLTCFRLNSTIGGVEVSGFDDFVDFGDTAVSEHGPIDGPHFTAKLYIVENHPHDARWAGFLRSGFGDDFRLPPASSPAALLLVAAEDSGRELYFAFPFGIAGRYLLRFEAHRRGYGLRAALNIIYAQQSGEDVDDVARMRAVEAKRRGPTVVRSRSQASEAADFEIFGVDRLRDVVNAATGLPRDPFTWGRRVSGSDALALDIPVDFDDIGELCLLIEDAYGRREYTEHFEWIDNIRPVADPDIRSDLEQAVLHQLLEADGEGLSLSPPEVIDWERVSSFHYHFDRRTRDASAVTHPDIRLRDYLNGARRAGLLAGLSLSQLRSRRIDAVDSSGSAVHRWSVWRCLVGELQLDGETFILDEGEFFSVAHDFLDELNQFVDMAIDDFPGLPDSPMQLHEQDYNAGVAGSDDRFLLLDRKNVTIRGRTTPVEICDLLSASRDLVHIKRHLGSSNLSHLFSQGYVSAELLRSDPLFRQAAHSKVLEVQGERTGFDFFDTSAIQPHEFNITFAVIADWSGRSLSEALPFFSKVNLQRFVENLRRLDFRVSFARIQTT